MLKIVLNKAVFFETKFYTVEDIVSGACSDNILDLVSKFTENIVLDLRCSSDDGANSFRFVIEGYRWEDVLTAKLELYFVSADINYGLNAKLIGAYDYEEISIDDTERLLRSIELPVVSNVTKERMGLKIKEVEHSETYEEIEYAREYEPLDCDCYPGECNHEPTWDYDYDRPIGVNLRDRIYTEKYLVLDLIELDDEDYE